MTLADGSVVTPEMVCEPMTPPQCFFILNIPDPSFISGLDSALKNSLIPDLLVSKEEPVKLTSVYHSVTKEVFTNPKYQETVHAYFKAPHIHHILDCW